MRCDTEPTTVWILNKEWREVRSVDRKQQVIEALGDWIVHVTAQKELATPEQIAALPEVAEVFLKHYPSFSFSSTKKE